ncbi:hypothetical protein TNCV_468321 [Trichonephila clavipes]|nr:hypothetical protein TNCV_468321 [Trichonephila clavipes]
MKDSGVLVVSTEATKIRAVELFTVAPPFHTQDYQFRLTPESILIYDGRSLHDPIAQCRQANGETGNKLLGHGIPVNVCGVAKPTMLDRRYTSELHKTVGSGTLHQRSER